MMYYGEDLEDLIRIVDILVYGQHAFGALDILNFYYRKKSHNLNLSFLHF